ncbi:MAG: efflux RND transporter periplasmic adaptor subunit [Patescibacteria group bacterium]|jgi:HlyD family secretion protein
MNVRKIFSARKVIWFVVIILIGVGSWYYLTKSKNVSTNIQTDTVKEQNIQATVLTTGQVVSQVNLNLSFQTSGVVKTLSVKSGDKVKAGDVLGTLNQDSIQAAVTSAQGTLAQARANYNKVVAGSSKEQINVSQKAVNAASVAYNNALKQLDIVKESTAAAINQAQNTLDDLESPMTQSDNKRSAIIVTLANQLAAVKSDLDEENKILNDSDLKDTFSVANSTSLSEFKNANSQVQGLLTQANTSLATAQAYKSDTNIYQAINDATSVLNQNITALNACYTALQNSIVSQKFSQSQLDAYKSTISSRLSGENSGISLINSARQALTDALTLAKNAVENANLTATQQITSAQNQINSAQAALQQAQATLAQQSAKAQSTDIAMAQAQILSAQGTVDAARANLNNTYLKAPVDGTITSVDTKIGQQVSALQEVVVLQDINSLHTESYVSEANIASLQIDQTVDYTFDALGPDNHFSGKILTIDPASTVISGVVDYLVKATLPNIPEIKPGMTVNMTIEIASKNKVLAVPSSALIDQNNQSYIRIIDNTQTKNYHQVPVQIGLRADGGLVEIISGLSAGQEIVTYIKP